VPTPVVFSLPTGKNFQKILTAESSKIKVEVKATLSLLYLYLYFYLSPLILLAGGTGIDYLTGKQEKDWYRNCF
jgi:hypothetical protein